MKDFHFFFKPIQIRENYEKCYKGEGHGATKAHDRAFNQARGIREVLPKDHMFGPRSGQRVGAFP